MKILAIDTATEACSVALNTGETVVSRFEICPQQHSQRLLPMVDEVLSGAGVTLADLDLLAFGRGPGSFTGVRIATGMIQGLALGSGLKVAGVSTLAAMAQQAVTTKQATWVVCATDARMGEVYFAMYKAEAGLLQEMIAEQVCPPDVAVALTNDFIATNPHAFNGQFEAVGTGWEAYPELNALLAQNSEISIQFPDAAYMLLLAQQSAEKGDVQVASEVKPVYLRDNVTWKKLPAKE